MEFTLLMAALAAVPSIAPVQGTGVDWPTYNGNQLGDRYSTLHEITAANVHRLRPVARFETGTIASFQTGPIVVDGVLYCTTYKHTYAIDAATGKLKWKDVSDIKKTGLGSNRGAAFSDGRVFRGFSNGYVLALDATTGKRLWISKIADPKKGESIPMAPIASDGLVYVGNAGGDNYAVTGRVYALDASTGKQVWRFDTVPKTGPAAATWKNKSIPQAGGATWTTYGLDTENTVLYVCAGNPAPDFDLGLRPGANLYTNCLLALDAKSGRLLGYVQPTKNDMHDWDISAAPALITTKAGKKLAALGGKDGFLHGIDVRSMTTDSTRGSNAPVVFPILYHTPVTRRFNTQAKLTTTRFTRFAPGSQGGVEWNGPSYDPVHNLIFTPAIDWPVSVKLAPRQQLLNKKPGDPWSGSHDGSFGKTDPPSKWGGYLTAVNADSGKEKWKYRATTPLVAAVTSTAGGVVFAADINGDVRAFDSSTGRSLWRHHIGRPCGGGIVTYESGGRQYVAVATGMSSPIWPTKPSTGQIVIYRLP
jgi:alcohol dehydrogenase (cytochrome c)